MRIIRTWVRIAAGPMLAALTGCGGGGDGGGGVSTLSYTGNTNQAVITTGNGAKWQPP